MPYYYLAACEKETLKNSEFIALSPQNSQGYSSQLSTTTPQNSEFFFIDNQPVSQEQFSWDIDTLWYHVVLGEKENPNSLNQYYYAYTNKSLYDQKLRSEIGTKHDLYESIIAHLSAYAVSSGAVDSLELTGSIPQSYLDYEAAYLAANLPKDSLLRADDRGSITNLFKLPSCSNMFNFSLPLLGTPFFIFNNNEADSMWPLFIGGHHKAFDRSFYRRQMFSVTAWAMRCYTFPIAFRNRTSSWWSIGL